MFARLALTLVLALTCAAPAAAHPLDRWESAPAAPLPRQEAALAELDGKLYLAGGFEEGGAESARLDVYDIATQTWAPGVPMPEPAHHLAGVGLNGRVYFAGGLQTLFFNPTGRMWVYDPATGAWSTAAGLPAGRERGAGAMVVHDGRIIYAGGQRIVVENATPRRIAVGYVDVYDPATDTWSPLADMPTPREHFGAAVVGDTLYAVGGRQMRLDLPVVTTEALDLRTGKWRTGLAAIPTPRGGFATGVVGREIITAGGESPDPAPPTPLDAHVNDEVEAYDPATDRWRTRPSMPLPRFGIQGATSGGGLWIAGGGVGLSVRTTNSLDVFYPGRVLGGG